MKTAILTSLLLFLTTIIFAQQPSMRWGKISDAAWDMEICTFDTAASAVILMENESIFFANGRAYLSVHRRIKILNKKGFEAGNLAISFYHFDNNEWISKFKGATFIKNETGKVEKIKVKDKFTEELNKYHSQFKVAFPAIKKGAIIEYKYEFSTTDLLNLEAWEFQHELPTVFSRVGVATPDWLRYQVISFGDKFNDKYDNEVARKEWVLENLPGYKDEDYTYNPKDYINKIYFQVYSYLGSTGWKDVLEDWDEVGKDKMKDYKKVFKRGLSNKHLLDDVLSVSDTEAEKVKKIVQFIRKTYTWNQYYATHPGKSFTKMLKTKEGDLADLNLWMIALMRSIGLQADPVLISTKSNGKPIVSYPIVKQFNAVICAVMIDGKQVLIDAVERGGQLPYDLLPKEDLNYIGLHLGKDSTTWINIPFDKKSRTQMLIDFDFTAGTALINGRFTRYVAHEKRSAFANGGAVFEHKPYQGMLGQEVELGKAVVKNQNNPEKPFPFTIDVTLGELPEDDLLYFVPALWTGLAEAPFKKVERTLPVELPYPYSKQIVVKLNYPAGYTLAEAPEDSTIKLPENLGTFSYVIQQKENYCMMSIRLQMKEVYMTPPTYFSLKEFFEMISQKVNEAIVFKKM